MDPFSIVFLGSSGVGKSCLCVQFCQRYFNESYERTIQDVYLTSLTYNGNTVRTQIIDIGGSDDLQSLREEVLVQNVAFVLVYSISDRDSFVSVCNLFTQLQRARQGDAISCVLVGNKLDQHIHRAVAREEGAKFSAERGVAFVEVSATLYKSTARLFRVLLRFSYEREVCNDGTETTAENEVATSSKQALQKKKKHRLKSTCNIM